MESIFTPSDLELFNLKLDLEKRKCAKRVNELKKYYSTNEKKQEEIKNIEKYMNLLEIMIEKTKFNS
jgi:hypothetical protein